MNKVKVFRQGDVNLIPAKVDLKQAEKIKPDKDRGTVLAYGEVTGHAHVLPASTTKQFRLNGKEYVEISSPSILRHEEHAPINLPAGIYEKVIAREYSPAGVKKVVD